MPSGKRLDEVNLINMKQLYAMWNEDLFTFGTYCKQGKKACKTTALRCYQCFRLRFLLATEKWLPQEKKLHYGELLTATERSKAQ